MTEQEVEEEPKQTPPAKKKRKAKAPPKPRPQKKVAKPSLEKPNTSSGANTRALV